MKEEWSEVFMKLTSSIAYIVTLIYSIIFTSKLGVAVELKDKQKQKALIINAIIFIIGFIVGILVVI